MILSINILTTTILWQQYILCKLLTQVHNIINIWYLNITSEKKNHHNSWAIGINTTNRTYQIDYDIFSYISQSLWGTCAYGVTWAHIGTYTGWEYLSSQIMTDTRISITCTIKWYILIYIAVSTTYAYRCYYLNTYWYTYGMRDMIWCYYHIC